MQQLTTTLSFPVKCRSTLSDNILHRLPGESEFPTFFDTTTILFTATTAENSHYAFIAAFGSALKRFHTAYSVYLFKMLYQYVPL